MNENDKILINAYFDGELSDDEIKYVENLISSNELANDYANNIKKANTEFDLYFSNSEFSKINLNIDTFIKELKSNNKSKKTFYVKKYFSFQALAGYALAATFIFFIAIPSQIGLLKNYAPDAENYDTKETEFNLFNGDLSTFGRELITLEYDKYRGANEYWSNNTRFNELPKDLLIQSIDHMVENKLINVSIVYGESSYYVKLESLELNTRYEYCLKGYIKHKKNDKDFTFCSLIDEKTINYIN